MAYRIDFDIPLEDEARRIARELIDDAIDLLENQPKGLHEAIHDARKNIKRVRALYRLIASDIGDFQKAENVRLRDIGRALSHLRDTAVLAETADYLEQETEQKETKSAIRRLGRAVKKRRDRIADTRHEVEDTLLAAADSLRDAGKAVKDLSLPKLRKQTIACVCHGWRTTGRKALKAMAACEHTDADEPFHDLRKRAQDRFMHAALLTAAWPAGMSSIQRQAKALVDTLGREHDLAVLDAQVRADKERSAEDREPLLQSITTERQKLQQAGRELGREVFDEKPKRDAEIVALLIGNRG